MELYWHSTWVYSLYRKCSKCLKSYVPRAMANEKTDEIIACTIFLLLNIDSQITFAPTVHPPRAFSCQVCAKEDVVKYTKNILRQFISLTSIGVALIERNYNYNNPQEQCSTELLERWFFSLRQLHDFIQNFIYSATAPGLLSTAECHTSVIKRLVVFDEKNQFTVSKGKAPKPWFRK